MEVMMDRPEKGQEPAMFNIHLCSTTYQRWQDLGVSQQLTDDEDIALFLLNSYEKGKTEKESDRGVCTRCQAPLSLLCVHCDVNNTQQAAPARTEGRGVHMTSGSGRRKSRLTAPVNRGSDQAGEKTGDRSAGGCQAEHIGFGLPVKKELDDGEEVQAGSRSEVSHAPAERRVHTVGVKRRGRAAQRQREAEIDDESAGPASPFSDGEEESPSLDNSKPYPNDEAVTGSRHSSLSEAGKVVILQRDGDKNAMQITPCFEYDNLPQGSGKDAVKTETSEPVKPPLMKPPRKKRRRPSPASALKTIGGATNGTSQSGSGKSGEPQCPQCGRRFKSKRNIRVHVQLVHTPDHVWKHQCHLCDKTFRNKEELLSHIAAHENLNPYQCSKCGKTFRYKQSLVRHGRMCGIVKPRRVCKPRRPKITEGQSTDADGDTGDGTKVRKNRASSSSDLSMPCICDQCGKTFKNRRNIKVHINLVHTKDYEWKNKCHICEKTFRNKEDCLSHIAAHDNVKLYLCCHCGKSYYRKQSLLRHTMGCSTRPKGKKEPKLECDTCHKLFRKHASLVEHVRAKHGEGPKQCMRCGECFAWRNSLRRHLMRDSCLQRKRRQTDSSGEKKVRVRKPKAAKSSKSKKAAAPELSASPVPDAANSYVIEPLERDPLASYQSPKYAEEYFVHTVDL